MSGSETIENTFYIAKRGLIITPCISAEKFAEPTGLEAELINPNGSSTQATLSLLHTFVTPYPKKLDYDCLLRNLQKNDVPIGTEVWHKDRRHIG